MLTQIWADKTFLSLLHDTNKDGKIFNLNHHLEQIDGQFKLAFSNYFSKLNNYFFAMFQIERNSKLLVIPSTIVKIKEQSQQIHQTVKHKFYNFYSKYQRQMQSQSSKLKYIQKLFYTMGFLSILSKFSCSYGIGFILYYILT